MRHYLRLFIVIASLLALALTLAACEKERPAPPAGAGTGTPAADTRGGNATVQPGAVTRVVLPNTSGGAAGETPAAAAPQAPAATPAPIDAAPQAGTGERTHTVAAGETLARIAARYGVTAESIMAANNLTNPDLIYPGQQLKIPGSTGGAATGGTGGSSGTTTTYTVKAGETLFSIATRFGVTLADLQRVNNIPDPNQVYAGQVLVIPVAGGGAAAPAAPTASSQVKTYTVQRGDTLASIARRYGVTVAALQQANNITDPNTIRPGQVLTIP